jgi:diguanylate cyclase (GGDEF)-like protein
MPAAPKPDNEELRLARLRALNILDTAHEAVFDRLTRLAASIFATPIAALSLVDEDRQWFKSIHGLDVRETPRDQAFCAHAILHPGEVMVVEDAQNDPRFADNPLVLGDPGIRFYAGAPVLDGDGVPLGTLCVIDRVPRGMDAVARAQLADLAAGLSSAMQLHGALQSLGEISRTDPLTGAASRLSFDAALRQLRDNPPRDGSVALIMIDVDGFRLTNEVFGHAGGDAVLREVARRMRRVIRPRDMLARLDGDEFGLLCPGIHNAAACDSIADRLRTAMADSYSWNGNAIPLRISIGAALYPDDDPDPEAVMAMADAALSEQIRRCKEMLASEGADTPTEPSAPTLAPGASPSHTSPLRRAGAGIGRLRLREALHTALLPPGQEPFTLRFQPIVSLQRQRRMPSLWTPGPARSRPRIRAGDESALEALIRWPMPDGRVVPPGEFITIAEENGLIGHLDRWVLENACRTAAGWPQDWGISVNMSAANVALGGVADMVGATLDRTGLSPRRLTLEVTETVLAADRAGALAVINALRRMGVAVALDDFGGGHASLTYLHHFPFSLVKVDRSLVANLATSSRAEAVMATVVELGHTLGVPVVAEGVETPEQLRLLADLGVDRAQGFLLGRPVSEEAVSGAVGAAEAAAADVLAPGAARGVG